MRATRRVLLLTLASVSLAVAAAGPDPSIVEGRETDRGAVTSGGSFYVEWWTVPAPLPRNEIFEIHFRVLEPADRSTPLKGAVVTASAWMPEHNHGTPLEPQVESYGDGTAIARGFLLQMEGHWELRVGVMVGGQMERVAFDVDVGP